MRETTDRFLVAWNKLHGDVVILQAQGPWAEYEHAGGVCTSDWSAGSIWGFGYDGGVRDGAEEKMPSTGVWVWEGRVKYSGKWSADLPVDWEADDRLATIQPVYIGKWRALTAAEWNALSSGKLLWKPATKWRWSAKENRAVLGRSRGIGTIPR